jgi:hypothetical protein
MNDVFKRRLELAWQAHAKLKKQLIKFIEEQEPLIDGSRDWVHVKHESGMLNAIADLLNKEDPSGVFIIEEMLLYRSTSEFYAKYMDKLYAYREWIEEKVSPVEYRVEDIDAEYRRRFDILHNVSEEA